MCCNDILVFVRKHRFIIQYTFLITYTGIRSQLEPCFKYKETMQFLTNASASINVLPVHLFAYITDFLSIHILTCTDLCCCCWEWKNNLNVLKMNLRLDTPLCLRSLIL